MTADDALDLTPAPFPPRVRAFLDGLVDDLTLPEWAAIGASPAVAAITIHHFSACTVALRQLGLAEQGRAVSDAVRTLGYPIMRLTSNGHAGALTPNTWATAELLAEWAARALLAQPALDPATRAVLTAPFTPYFPLHGSVQELTDTPT